MSRITKEQWQHYCSFPRVSGDEPADAPHAHAARVFSPRERG